MIRRFLNPKIILLLLGVVLVVEGFFAFRNLRGNIAPPPPKLEAIGDGQIILNARKKDYRVGEVVPVAVSLSTGGRSVEGTDVILKFNPALLEATSGAILKGHLFAEYPVVKVDSKEGSVTIAGITSARQRPFNGSGLFAFVYFKAKAAGQGKVQVDFKPNLTTDSNMVESKSAKDILGKVSDLNINIK